MMKTATYALLVLAALLVARAPEAAPTDGTVTGTVKFMRGKDEKAVTDGYVYLVPVRRGRPIAPQPRGATIRQRNYTFTPNRVVIPVGSSVAFPNDDSDEHNVFSPSNPVFDLSRYGRGVSKSRLFEDEGEYDIYCDRHFEMNAKVKVVDSDRIVQVVNGAFKLENVPAGKYKVVAWAPDSAESKETITVVAGETFAVPQLNVQLGQSKTDHRRKDGSEYCDPVNGKYCKK